MPCVHLYMSVWCLLCLKVFSWYFAVASLISITGEMRVQLLNQTLLDLGFYDDGPYEVADQKQLNAQLIPVPYHSYLGRICPPCSLLPVHRREREGWGRATAGLRLYSNMAAVTTGASNSSNRQTSSNRSFPVDYFWMSLCVTHKALNMTPPYFLEHFPMWMWVDMWKNVPSVLWPDINTSDASIC